MEVLVPALGSPALPLDALDLTPDQVQLQLRQAREHGRPFFPWPDVPPAAWRGGLSAIENVVRQVMGKGVGPPGAGSAPVPLEAGVATKAIGVAAFTSGTGPLLGHWIETGSLSAAPQVSRLLLLHLEHGRLRAERMRAGLRVALGLLARAGVAATVVKGFHTAHSYFPEPGARPLADVDLVVAPEDVPRASAALGGGGFAPRAVLPNPYMCEWSPPGEGALPRSLELTHARSPWTLDLHGSFDRDFGGVHRVSVVPRGASTTEPWTDAGIEARVLAQPYLSAYLAAHASQELRNLTLVRLVELVWVLRRGAHDGTLRWGELEELLRGGRAGTFVYPAFELAERLAPGTLPPSLRAALAAASTPRLRRIVGRLGPASAQRLEAVSLEEHFMWARTPFDHLRRAWRVLWPVWAGPFPGPLRVQATRARQLLARRVVMGGRDGAS